MSTREWIITTEQRQAQRGESYVYENDWAPPSVFPAFGPTNADDAGGPYRHVIVGVRRAVSQEGTQE